jgi:hypothetical protein
MLAVLENILIMIITVLALIGGGYLLLVIIEWGLKAKSGSREREGLSDLWIASQADKPEKEATDGKSRGNNTSHLKKRILVQDRSRGKI